MTKERRTRRARVLLAATALAVIALAWAPTAAVAKDTGISGTVENGTTKEPVPDLKVTLTMFDTQAQVGQLTATTDADGAFSFPTPVELTQNYQLQATYADVLYSSPVAPYSTTEPNIVKLTVFETTTDPANITVPAWTVWVDQEGDGAAVQHDFEWNNSGNTAYIGPIDPNLGPVTTKVSVEPGATNPQYRGVYLDFPGKIQGDTYVNPYPVMPGGTSATIRYSVTELSSLTLTPQFPTTTLQMFVPSGVAVSGQGLSAQGTVTDKGITYQVFTAQNLKADQMIEVALDGLTGGGGVSPLLWVGIGIVVVAGIVGLVVWLVLRRRSSSVPARRPSAAAKARRPQEPAKNGRARETATARRTQVARARAAERDVSEQADLLIDEIAALDLAYEKGLIEQRSYESLRSAAKERLLRLREAPAEEEEGAAR